MIIGNCHAPYSRYHNICKICGDIIRTDFLKKHSDINHKDATPKLRGAMKPDEKPMLPINNEWKAYVDLENAHSIEESEAEYEEAHLPP